MDELINLVVQKTGLPADGARKAVDTVIEYLKARLPGPLAGQVDGLLNNAGGAGLRDLAKSVSDLFGKK
jgi:hypothetical protein